MNQALMKHLLDQDFFSIFFYKNFPKSLYFLGYSISCSKKNLLKKAAGGGIRAGKMNLSTLGRQP